MVDKKDKSLDSLKAELRNCKRQAEIMADILENEKIELHNKKLLKSSYLYNFSTSILEIIPIL